jgi:tetratricopeptide (TPR) repeat protein
MTNPSKQARDQAPGHADPASRPMARGMMAAGVVAHVPHAVSLARAPRASTWRQNLRAATMLVPVVAIGVIATGKIAAHRVHLGGLVETAQAQPAGSIAPSTGIPGVGTHDIPGHATPTPAAPVVTSTSASPAVTVLLEKANYWRNLQQYDQAAESLNRALALDPNNTQALALLGMIDADRGNRTEAQAVLTRLQAAAPGDPGIDKIQQSLRIGAIPPDALADARKLASDKREAEAVQEYNRIFHGNPPPDRLSVEYYQTLAGTENGWEQARDGLARVVRQNPEDIKAQLAYAELLTYRDGSRAEGIQRLMALSRNATLSEHDRQEANNAWRQALDWLPADKSSIPAITVYLSSHPGDTAMATKLQAARNPGAGNGGPGNAGGNFTPDPETAARLGGFDELNHNRLAEAARDFQKSIDANPNDADALGGLGIVRLRQRNYGEARQYLSRAIALDPDHRNQWQNALDAAIRAGRGYGGGGGAGENQAAAAQRLLNRGDYAGAERELKRQIARNIDRSGGLQAMLADAQAQQGRLGDAEASYRDALARNPRNTGAVLGLAGILSREGRSEEAQRMLAQAETMGGGRQAGQARALLLREQAQGVSDPATQAALYREALSSDPSNPWLRLDLARSLVRQGQVNEARAVMAQGVSGRNASPDALKAGIIFANETSDPDSAAALIQRLPASARTADMSALQAQASLQREIGAALALPHEAAVQRLVAMAAQPDPQGVRGPAIGRALYKINEPNAAREALLMARSRSTNAAPGVQLAYAGALFEVGDSADAQQTVNQIGSGAGLSPQQLRDLAQLRAGMAVRTSDQLNDRGRQAQAYNVLAPQLARTPDNPDLNMALARLYTGAKDPREALAINEALLRRDPNNEQARRGAIEAALAARDYATADELVQQAVRAHPNDPQVWISSAEVAKARGNNGRALRDYERARDLRMQQLGYADNGSDTSTLPGTLSGVSLVPGGPATYAPVTPRAAPLTPGARPTYALNTSVPPANQDGGGGGSTPPIASPAAARPSAAPPNFYPDGAGPRAAGGPAAAATAPGNFDIPHGRMLDTSPADLPAPGPVAPVSPPPVTNAAVVPPRAVATPAAAVATPVSAPPPPAPLVPASLAPPVPLQAAVPPPAAVRYQDQYVPSPLPQYQEAQFQPGQYPPPQDQAPPAAPAAGYGNIYQPSPTRTATPPVSAAPLAPSPLAPPAPPSYALPASAYPAPVVPAAPVSVPSYSSPARSYPAYPAYPQARQANVPSVLSPNVGAGPITNPFLSPGATTLAAPAPSVPPDAVTAEIDRNIVSLRDEVAPALQGGIGIRYRTGDAGLDRLTQYTVPLQAEFSPGGGGRLTLEVTPTDLEGGTVAGFNTNATNLGRFGTSALFLHPGSAATGFLATYSGVAPASQSQQGVGLDAKYAYGNFTADIGSTPQGFQISSLVGGVEWVPALRDNLRLRLTAEQRAVDDSVLSYAGTTDPSTGTKWGGEVRDRGHANLELTQGLANFYVGAGGGEVRGSHVPTNAEFEAGLGGSYPFYRAPGQELRVGLDLVYFGYNKNLDHFSLGQGGYFSPQSYGAALIPVIWREQVDEDLKYEVGVAVGLQTYHEASSPYFPQDAGLQAALVAQQASAATAVPGQITTYPSRSSSGFAGAGHGQVDYRVAPNFTVGAKANLQHSGNWTEISGLVYARYLFNGTISQ